MPDLKTTPDMTDVLNKKSKLNKMSLKIDDVVEVVIVQWNLHGLHNVKIIGSNYYKGLLIPIRNKTQYGTYWSGIYYEGLKVPARVVRMNNQFMDLVEVPKQSRPVFEMHFQDKRI